MDSPISCRVRWGVSVQEITFSVEPVVFTVLELVHKEQRYGKSIGRSYVNEWTSPFGSLYSNSRDVPNSTKAVYFSAKCELENAALSAYLSLGNSHTNIYILQMNHAIA